jgi:hypothetical protein
MPDYQIVVRLPADLADQLKARAAREDRPIARVIRAALRDYLRPPAPWESQPGWWATLTEHDQQSFREDWLAQLGPAAAN